MFLEEKEFDDNSAIHFTAKELEIYRKLEEIAKKNNTDFNWLIVQTSQDILTIAAALECLVVERGKIKREIVLPYIDKEYANPLKLEDILGSDSDYGLQDEEVDLGKSILDALIATKDLYFGVKFKEGVSEEDGSDPISEIFEIGFNYLDALVKLTQRGYTGIKILDKNGKTIEHAIKAAPILISLKTEREKTISDRAELRQSIERMRESLSGNKIPIYPYTVGYEQKLIEKRQKK